jgi:hypothetical protein
MSFMVFKTLVLRVEGTYDEWAELLVGIQWYMDVSLNGDLDSTSPFSDFLR